MSSVTLTKGRLLKNTPVPCLHLPSSVPCNRPGAEPCSYLYSGVVCVPDPEHNLAPVYARQARISVVALSAARVRGRDE